MSIGLRRQCPTTDLLVFPPDRLTRQLLAHLKPIEAVATHMKAKGHKVTTISVNTFA